MADKTSLDGTDFRILKLLMQDARTPYLEIARICGISGAAIHQRMKKMEDSKIVSGTRLLVSPDALNLNVCAFVNIKVSQPDMINSVVEKLKEMTEVVECHFIMGQFTLLVKIYCRDNAHLMDVLVNRVLKISGVSDTSSFISLKQLIDRPVPVISTKQQLALENNNGQ
ncbi:transcriptional regulator [Bacteroidia bacterium]|nr:transcriptional regulator [Bacteroidia bacterium]GHT80275.1 transcriptional regulator [Bacteroidia bacterium]